MNPANRLKELREEYNLTQEEFSKILNVSQVAYSYYEIGKRSIPIDLLIKIANYYETSTDYILYLTDERKAYKKSYMLVENNC